ncbi:MAG: EI24 domain-containing protein, partial [Pseudomonadota bacterium]
MLITATTTTLSQIFSPPFRAVLWKALGLTVALFIGLWFALEALVSVFLLPVLPPWPWLTTAFAFLLGGGIVIGGGFVLAPVSAVFAGIFLDDVAEAVERKHYPSDPVGNPLSVLRSTLLSARFLALVVGANLLALALVLFVGLGVVVFFLVNGY